MTPEQVQAAAAALYEAEQARRQIPALTLTYPDMDMDDAYRVQEAWVQRKVREGDAVIGYKIGLTSRAMQMAMQIDTPDYGVLLESMRFETGATIHAGDFCDPSIEVEFAFVMGRALSGADVTLEQVLEATDYIVPALELIAARSYRRDPASGYTRTVLDTIADNAANAGIITGDRRLAPSELDLRCCTAMTP